MTFPHNITGSLWPTFVPVRRVCLTVKQTYTIALLRLKNLEFTFARLRYFLGGDRPSQTTNHALFWLSISLRKIKEHYFTGASDISRNQVFIGWCLSYTIIFLKQYKGEVKVHRVFPSCCEYSASSRRIQFRWVGTGDSGEVVTPFMRVSN